MTRDKDLKRVVRARMMKTGESYTAARARVTSKPARKASTPAATVPETGASDYARLAGMSDAAVLAKTGCAWDKWVHALDRKKAHLLTHREIAAIVRDTYAVNGWWAQQVTVGYERIKGLRERGKRRDGAFEASKSRTFPVAVETLYKAWAEPRRRRRWLAEKVKVRTATAPRSMRFDWPDGSRVALWFEKKGDAKSVVTVQHLRLPDREVSDRMKQFWAERLDALQVALTG